ncbi:MAG: hypothetical protein QGG54_03600 [Gammaproteobacteria bacterium]|jgi:hypothetical protein|nr:hypothetical protein [Gammaproteobacteria bacterium]MDP6652561.1 hypothetical protein [Gammaproteobacteria bacterium]
MRITILANRDLLSCIALNRLVPAFAEHQLHIFLSATVGRGEHLSTPMVCK